MQITTRSLIIQSLIIWLVVPATVHFFRPQTDWLDTFGIALGTWVTIIIPWLAENGFTKAAKVVKWLTVAFCSVVGLVLLYGLIFIFKF